MLSSPQAYLDTIDSQAASHIRERLAPAYREGFQIVFLAGAASCAFAFVVVLFMIPQLDLSERDAKPGEEEEEERKTQQASEK